MRHKKKVSIDIDKKKKKEKQIKDCLSALDKLQKEKERIENQSIKLSSEERSFELSFIDRGIANIKTNLEAIQGDSD